MPNQKLEAAIGKISGSFPITEGEWDPDCVSVDLKQSPYLLETATGLYNDQNTGQGTNINLHYENGLLKMPNGTLADTTGVESKKYKNSKAFIMSKDGEITLFNHGRSATHGSAAKAKPLEAAGVISIINGKITSIVDDSGHYTPDKYDLYRMVKSIDEKMPGVISEECIISPIPERIEEKINLKKSDFLAHMEQEIDGIPLWKKMRNDRILEHEKMHLMHSFNSNPKPHTLDMIAKKVIIDISNSSFTSAIANLSREDKKKLIDTEYSIVLKKDKELRVITISELVKDTLKENTPESRTILFESGLLDITREEEFKRNLLSLRIDKLIKEGVDLSNSFNKDGDNVLAYYIKEDPSESEQTARDKIFLLSNSMPHPNSPNRNGETAAHIATSKSLPFFRQAVDAANLDWKIRDNSGKTPLDYIIKKNDIEKLDILLKSGRDIGINLVDEDGRTPLSNSINTPQIFSMLLNAKSDVNHISSYTGLSTLHLIIKIKTHQDTKILEELLKHNPDVNLQEKGDHTNSDTALHIASREGKTKMVDLLLKSGANPNIKNKYGETALDLAIKKENVNTAKLLLTQENLALDNKGLMGNTVLHNSMDIKHNNYEITRMLLDKGANPNAQNNLGETPLHRAIKTGNHELVAAFMEKGANIQIKDKEGKTPLDYAMSIKDTEIKQNIIQSLTSIDQKLKGIVISGDAPKSDHANSIDSKTPEAHFKR
ncbi:MAG: hypothetical protein RLZZ59_82 [Pseudomonadota bacterium]